MKGQKGKRILSFILALAILLGVYVPNTVVQAADPPVIGEDHPSQPGEVMLFKKVEEVPNRFNICKVTLRMEAKDAQKSNDIVMVIDIPNSMNGDKLVNAKKAAKQFVEQLLTADHPDTRISLVTFGTDSSRPIGFVNYENKQQLLTYINNLTVAGGAAGGTQTQGGVHLARTALADSVADMKQVVLLSDGQPTYSYRIPNYLDYSQNYATNRYETRTDVPESEFRYNTRVGNGSSLRQFIATHSGNDYYYNNGNSAIAEAGFVKSSPVNATLHTIALDARTTGTPILEAMASEGKFYNTTEPTELEAIFQTIAADILSAMSDIEVADPMGTGFNVAGGTVGQVTVSQGTYSVNESKTRIDWDLGPVLLNQVEGLQNVKYAELSYFVEINSSILGVVSDDGQYDTNDQASVSYLDINGIRQNKDFPQPTAKPLIIELKKELRDANGNLIASDPYDRNFHLNVLAPGAYNLDYYIDGNTSDVMVDIKIDIAHTISERGETRGQLTGNLDDYETSIKWNSWEDGHTGGPVDGRTFTGFMVPKYNNGDPINTTITVTNTEKALGKLYISKEFLPDGENPGTSTGVGEAFTVEVEGKNYYDQSQTVYGPTSHEVKVGETIELSNLPYGYYTVTEPDSRGFDYEVSYKDSNNNPVQGQVTLALDGKTGSATVTNKPKQDDLLKTFTATKTWSGAGGLDEHVEVDLSLYANGSKIATLPAGASGPDIVKTSSDDASKTSVYEYTWQGLPKWGGDGKEIKYTVQEETTPAKYDVSYNYEGDEVTNTYNPQQDKITVTASKVWVGGPADKPATWFTLWRKDSTGANDEKVAGAETQAIPTAEPFTVSWEVPWGDGQGAYTYYVKETDEQGIDELVPTNYVKTGGDSDNPLTITNTYQSPPTGELVFTKNWVNGPDDKPEVSFQLMRRGGSAGSGEEVGDPKDLTTPSGQTSSTVTFESQDKTDNKGIEYTYYVKEVGESGGTITLPSVGGLVYSVAYDEVNKSVTNTYTPAKIPVKANKVWVDGPELKPEVGLQLYQQIEGETDVDIVSGATPFRVLPGGGLEGTWTLPERTDKGELITYTVKEVIKENDIFVNKALENYEKVESGLTVTNTYKSPTDDIEANKIWVEGSAPRPTVWFELYRQAGTSGQLEKLGDRKQLDDGVTSVVWNDMDLTDTDGVAYIYSVKEVNEDGENLPPANYLMTEDGRTVTNTYQSPTTDVTVEKVWVNGESVRPDSVDVSLTGTATDADDYVVNLTLNKADNFMATTTIPTHAKNGNPYTYTIHEDGEADGKVKLNNHDWTVTYDQENFKVTNEYMVPNTDEAVKATKEWSGSIVGETARPEIYFQLQRKTEDHIIANVGDAKKVEGTEVDFGVQAKTDEKGNLYTYSVKEVNAEGEDYTPINYTKVEEGLKVTNTVSETNAPIKINKIYDNTVKSRSRAVLRFDVKITDPYGQEETITLTPGAEATEYTAVYKGVYTIEELNAADYEVSFTGATAVEGQPAKATFEVTDNTERSITVTNKANSQNLEHDIRVEKVWVNGDDVRPDTVDVTLTGKADGADDHVVNLTLKKDEDYKAKATVPTHATNGNPYTYTIHEDGEADGKVKLNNHDWTVTYDQENFKVTNEYVAPQTDELIGTKVWVEDYDPEIYPKLTRPDIKLELWRKGGEAGEGERVEEGQAPNKQNTVNFGKQDKTDKKGVVYTYFVHEVFVDLDDISIQNWIVKESGMRVTNTLRVDPDDPEYPDRKTDKYADLTITKVLESETSKARGASSPLEFGFKVEGEYGYEKTFILKAGQTEILENLFFGNYKVTETDSHGFEVSYSPANGEVVLSEANDELTVIVTNRNTGGDETNVKALVKKVWVNGPKPATDLELWRRNNLEGDKAIDEKVNTFTTTAGQDSEFEFTTTSEGILLAKYDGQGNEYEYYAKEPEVPENYTSKEDGLTVTNTYVIPQTDEDILANKVWDIEKWDYENYPNLTYTDIKFELWRTIGTIGEGVKVDGVERQTPDAQGEVNFGKQDETDIAGKPYTYFVKEYFTDEDDPWNDNWVVTEDGLTVTNRIVYNDPDPDPDPDHDDEKIGSLTVRKELKVEPSGVLMALNADPLMFKFRVTGPAGFEKTFELAAGESKTLDELYYGKYVVEEIEDHDYIPTYSTSNGQVTLRKKAENAEVVVTNVRSGGDEDPNTLDLTVNKVWVNGPKPNVLIELWRSGQDDEGNEIKETVGAFTANASDTSRTFSDLPKHDPSGREFDYYIEEAELENYISEIEGLTVTNTYVTPQTDEELIANKTWTLEPWDDQYNQEDAKPDIYFQLWRKNGTAGEGEPVSEKILVEGDSVNFGKQDETDIDGKAYTYFAKEFFVDPEDPWNDNWVASVDGLEVTNRIIYNNEPDEDPDPDHPKDEKIAKLTIEKELKGGSQKTFQMIVKGPKDFEKTVTVKAGVPYELDELYYGYYSVEEVGAKNYTTTYAPEDGQVELTKASSEARVVITNTLKETKPGTIEHKPSDKKTKASDNVIIARADLYPDSLTASVLARAVDAPILLTPSNRLDQRVADEIRRLGARKAYIIGGEISITPSTLAEIKAITGEVERIGGADRYETSALLAKRVADFVGNKHTAAIASGEVFPDALTISPFAAKEGYPILLVRKDYIPETVQDRMDSMGIEKTYISGGDNTISKAVEDMLPGVEMRMWGQDRYGTSEAIAKAMFPSSTTGFIASGQVFPDALVIGPIAAKENAPVLLVKHNEVPKVISDYLATSRINEMIIAGGPDTISEAVAKELDHNIDRIFGIDRIATAIAISERYYPSR